MGIKHFNSKGILLGDYVEIRHYEEVQFFDFSKEDFKVEKHKFEENHKKIRRRYERESMIRAINKSKKMLMANVDQHYDQQKKLIRSRFVTLTFGEHITDEDKAKKLFHNFNRTLKRHSEKLEIRLSYLGVWEHHKNGRIHFHIVYFNLHETIKLDLWKYGHIKSDRKITNNIEDFMKISMYISKTFKSKDFKHKSFIKSDNLAAGIEVKNDYRVNAFMKLIRQHKINEVYKAEMPKLNEYIGDLTIIIYDLRKLSKELSEELKEALLFD